MILAITYEEKIEKLSLKNGIHISFLIVYLIIPTKGERIIEIGT